MRDFIIFGFLAAVVLGTIILKHMQLTIAEDNAALWKAEVLQLRGEVSRWKAAHAQARAGEAAQAQACLDRESAARADAEEWRAILADMPLRSMSEEEKSGVPDDATRRRLLDSLDRPL